MTTAPDKLDFPNLTPKQLAKLQDRDHPAFQAIVKVKAHILEIPDTKITDPRKLTLKVQIDQSVFDLPIAFRIRSWLRRRTLPVNIGQPTWLSLYPRTNHDGLISRLEISWIMPAKDDDALPLTEQGQGIVSGFVVLQEEDFSVFRIHRSGSAHRKPFPLHITTPENYRLDSNCLGQACRIKVRWDIESNRLILKEFTEFVNLDPNFKPSNQPKTDSPTITDTQPSSKQAETHPPKTTAATVATARPPQNATIEADTQSRKKQTKTNPAKSTPATVATSRPPKQATIEKHTQSRKKKPKANRLKTKPAATVATPPRPQHTTIEAAYVAAANGQLVFKMGKRMIKTQGQLPNAKLGHKYQLKLEKKDDGLCLVEAKRL